MPVYVSQADYNCWLDYMRMTWLAATTSHNSMSNKDQSTGDVAIYIYTKTACSNIAKSAGAARTIHLLTRKASSSKPGGAAVCLDRKMTDIQMLQQQCQLSNV